MENQDEKNNHQSGKILQIASVCDTLSVMNQGMFTLLLGLLLGIKHAFEADHIIAVSTILTEQRNSYKSALVGTFWGIGHTATLFIVGIIILLAKVSIPARISNILEFGVGIMLVFLGIRNFMQGRILIHQHEHKHNNTNHKHKHYHKGETNLHAHHKSFFIGSVHGLAGSGALMILVLSTINSVTQGLYYIILFGIGSIFGMTAMSFIIGLPFTYGVNKSPNIEKYIRVVAGTLSIIFGLYVIYQIGIVEKFSGHPS